MDWLKQASVATVDKEIRTGKEIHTDEGDMDVSPHEAPGEVRM
jgi:hypothetical protein